MVGRAVLGGVMVIAVVGAGCGSVRRTAPVMSTPSPLASPSPAPVSSMSARGAPSTPVTAPVPSTLPATAPAPATAAVSALEGAFDTVTKVTVTADGNVWAATAGGVVRWTGPNGQTATEFTDRDGLPSGPVLAVAAAPDGSVWAAGQGWVGNYHDTWTVVTATDVPVFNADFGDLTVGPDGKVWVAVGSNRLVRYDGTQWTSVAPPPSTEASPWTTSLATTNFGMVWAPLSSSSGPVVCFDGTRWYSYPAPGPTSNLVVAPDSALWVGGARRHGDPSGDVPAVGVASSVDGGTTWKVFTVADGLAANEADVAVGADGTVWAVAAAGISRFNGATWTSYRVNGTDTGAGRGAFAAADGTLWMPSTHGVIRFDGTSTSRLTSESA